MTIRFDDQIIIITGAGGGLGRAYALAFAERGGHVIANDLNVAGAEETARLIADAGGSGDADRTNITDTAAVAEMISGLHEKHGRIDVLLNNAGIVRDRAYHNMTAEEWDAVLSVHLHGTHNLTQAVWPHMRAAGYGRIVMATSGSGLFGNFGQANYGAAKMALLGMMNTLAIEGVKYDIRVNAVAPVAYTQMTEGILPPAAKDLFTPDAVAPAVVYLAGKGAPTGSIISAGAGTYCASRIVETKGIALTDASPEDIESHFENIADFQTLETPGSSVEQVMKFAKNASGAT